MKKIFIVLVVFVMGASITSCTSSKVGCKSTVGMMGYH